METTKSLLWVSYVFISILFLYLIRVKNKTQLHKVVILLMCLLMFWFAGIISQLVFSSRYNIPPVYFEYFVYISACLLPVCLFFMSKIFVNTKIKFKKAYGLYFVIPVIVLLTLWTNDFHHLFFEYYSINMSEIITGPMHTINALYTYILLFWSVFKLIKYSLQNSGFFSKQSLLIVIGSLIPIIVNLLGTMGIIEMTVYVTPITFGLAISLYTLAIFKFQFLGSTPIALQRIVDRISDSYIIVNENGCITDFNKTFLTTFKIKSASIIRGENLEDFLKENNLYIGFQKIKDALQEIESSDKTLSFELYVKNINRYFNVEINSILSENQYLGTLILFKDITQHKSDIQTIKDTQDSLMESERLSSLGQLIGGIAHNLKTPIMSISGAAEGLADLVKEYDESIDDPTVNSQDHHEIAKDMSKWLKKIKEYTEYMSDVITAVKGQAVAMSNEDDVTFTVGELVKRVNILMKHELKNAIISLNVVSNVKEDLSVHGDVNNLVQVINNMISNAIQAYNGKKEETIEFLINKKENNVVFSIQDHAGGLPPKVKDKLFKEMITTKGKNGTGLGLYISYSTIKAHFNGNITYESETGKGTKFNIIIPT